MTPTSKECHTTLVIYGVAILLVICLMAIPLGYYTNTVVSQPLFTLGQTIRIPGTELTGTITYVRKLENGTEYEVRYFIDNDCHYAWVQDVELRK